VVVCHHPADISLYPTLPTSYTVQQINYTESQKIPDITDSKLRENYQILIIVVTNIPDTIGDKTTVLQVPTSPNVCFCTTCKERNKWNMRWNEQKTSTNFISSDLWPQQPWPQSIQLLCLRCDARCCLGMSINSRSDWLNFNTAAATLSTLLSMNGESVCMPVFAQMADILNICCKQLDNWTTG